MKNVTMYGSHLCQDTMYALMQLKSRGVAVDFRNFSVDFGALIEFMKYREEDPMFDAVKKRGSVGMPFFILEDGTKTFDWEDAVR